MPVLQGEGIKGELEGSGVEVPLLPVQPVEGALSSSRQKGAPVKIRKTARKSFLREVSPPRYTPLSLLVVEEDPAAVQERERKEEEDIRALMDRASDRLKLSFEELHAASLEAAVEEEKEEGKDSTTPLNLSLITEEEGDANEKKADEETTMEEDLSFKRWLDDLMEEGRSRAHEINKTIELLGEERQYIQLLVQVQEVNFPANSHRFSPKCPVPPSLLDKCGNLQARFIDYVPLFVECYQSFVKCRFMIGRMNDLKFTLPALQKQLNLWIKRCIKLRNFMIYNMPSFPITTFPHLKYFYYKVSLKKFIVKSANFVPAALSVNSSKDEILKVFFICSPYIYKLPGVFSEFYNEKCISYSDYRCRR